MGCHACVADERPPLVAAVHRYPRGLCRGALDRAVPAHEVVPDPKARKYGRLRALDAAPRPVAGPLRAVEPLKDVVVLVVVLAYPRPVNVPGGGEGAAAPRGGGGRRHVGLVGIRQVHAVPVGGIARGVGRPERDLVGPQIVADKLRGYLARAQGRALQQACGVEAVLALPYLRRQHVPGLVVHDSKVVAGLAAYLLQYLVRVEPVPQAAEREPRRVRVDEPDVLSHGPADARRAPRDPALLQRVPDRFCAVALVVVVQYARYVRHAAAHALHSGPVYEHPAASPALVPLARLGRARPFVRPVLVSIPDHVRAGAVPALWRNLLVHRAYVHGAAAPVGLLLRGRRGRAGNRGRLAVGHLCRHRQDVLALGLPVFVVRTGARPPS